MGYLVLIEKWAANLDEVTVNRWLKQEREPVEAGQSLCEIITEKVTFEYEVPEDGILRKTYCNEGSTVPVGYAIAFVGALDEPLPEGIEQQNAQLMEEYRQKPDLALDLDIALPTIPAPMSQGRLRATPAARHLAREASVELAEVAQGLGEDRPLSEVYIRAYLEDTKQQ